MSYYNVFEAFAELHDSCKDDEADLLRLEFILKEFRKLIIKNQYLMRTLNIEPTTSQEKETVVCKT